MHRAALPFLFLLSSAVAGPPAPTAKARHVTPVQIAPEGSTPAIFPERKTNQAVYFTRKEGQFWLGEDLPPPDGLIDREDLSLHDEPQTCGPWIYFAPCSVRLNGKSETFYLIRPGLAKAPSSDEAFPWERLPRRPESVRAYLLDSGFQRFARESTLVDLFVEEEAGTPYLLLRRCMDQALVLRAPVQTLRLSHTPLTNGFIAAGVLDLPVDPPGGKVGLVTFVFDR